MKNILLALAIGFWATGAIAHSPLDRTTPANDATLSEVPTIVTFGFKAKIRLTRVTMTHAEHKNNILDLSGHEGFILDYAVPMQPMGSGKYIIDWRGLGVDGHALSGTFSFMVK